MSHQEHFFLEYMPIVFASPKSPVIFTRLECDMIHQLLKGCVTQTVFCQVSLVMTK